MTKIIIENKTSRPDSAAVEYALKVMKRGRTQSSPNGWVYRRTIFDSGVAVEGSRNACSDRIIVSEVM